MPAYVIIIDIFGIVLAVAGFTMTFRQGFVRRLLKRRQDRANMSDTGEPEEDALTYILRIAGVMVMAFGISIAGMFTLYSLG
jgi:hypothetical protein